MKGIREIRSRIKSVKSTAQITRAMQLVASSKMKRAQQAAVSGQLYAQLLVEMLESLLQKIGTVSHPYFVQRPVKKRGILVLSTDKGLCGALNANLFRLGAPIKPGEAAFVCVGKKAAQHFARLRHEVLAEFPVSDRVHFREVKVIAQFMEKQFEEGHIDTIEVLYPAFLNTLKQEPVLAKLVPFGGFAEQLERFRKQFPQMRSALDDEREMLFEPSAHEIIEAFPPLFLRQEMYQMMLSAKASEHSARMVAMKAATDNADTLIGELTLQYNKARQEAITNEILAISSAQSGR